MVNSLVEFIASLNQTVAGKRYSFSVRKSNLVLRVLEKLLQRGYLQTYRRCGDYKIEVILRKSEVGIFVLHNIIYISRIGRRQHAFSLRGLKTLSKNSGEHLLSVSDGKKLSLLWTDEAFEKRKGGIILLTVL